MAEDENDCEWDVLSLSLVLNFVPDPRERGTGTLLARISLTPHVFREDVAAGSPVSWHCACTFGPLVRNGWYLTSTRELVADHSV